MTCDKTENPTELNCTMLLASPRDKCLMARAQLMHLVVGAIQLSRWPDWPRMIPRYFPDCTTRNDHGMNPASSSF
eukprot:3774478-Pyramimonas_sp.AAC.1